jgi:hypothetical protein
MTTNLNPVNAPDITATCNDALAIADNALYIVIYYYYDFNSQCSSTIVYRNRAEISIIPLNPKFSALALALALSADLGNHTLLMITSSGTHLLFYLSPLF